MSENVPMPSSPETPPLAPYDPPAPAPQAAAWGQALKVIGLTPTIKATRLVRISVTKTRVGEPKWI